MKEKPSKTARKVALNILVLGEDDKMAQLLPSGLVEATEKMLITSGALGSRVVQWHRSPRMLSVYKAFDWMMPGQFEAFVHRKLFCEDQVRKGIADGVTQVLVLGSGYDTMGWRLAPEFPDVNFFEIEHPATARLKAKSLETMGTYDNLHLISEDLGERKLIDVLTNTDPWDPTAKSVILAEGLLMYLSSEAVQDLFTQCAAISGSGSRIAFSYIGKDEDGRPDAGKWTWLLLWILKANGEPWLWYIEPDNLEIFLEETGWIYSMESAEGKKKHGVEYFAVVKKVAD